MSKSIEINFYDSSPVDNKRNGISWFLTESFLGTFIDSYDSIFQNYFKISMLISKPDVINQVEFAETNATLDKYITIKFPLKLWQEEINTSYFIEKFMKAVRLEFPQLIIHQGWSQCENNIITIGLVFVPIVIRSSTSPIQYGLEDSLRQQKGISAETTNIIDAFLDRLYQLTSEIIRTYIENKDDIDSINQNNEVIHAVVKNDENEILPAAERKNQYKQYEDNSAFYLTQIRNLQLEMNELKGELEKKTSVREKVLQKDLKREKRKNDKLLLSIKKMELDNKRIENELISSSKKIVRSSKNNVEEPKEWYQKKIISLKEYNYLMNKVEVLDKVWKTNLKLSKKVNSKIKDEDKQYKKTVNYKIIHRFTEDMQIFLVRNEAKSINERVKKRELLPFVEPTVVLLQGDYENLIEKTAYYDILNSENKVLEEELRLND